MIPERLSLALSATVTSLVNQPFVPGVPLTTAAVVSGFVRSILIPVTVVLALLPVGLDWPLTRDLIFYVIDADNFKEVNDRYGHNAGDRVLVELARRISSAIRNSDVLVRWGGEEFLVISRYTNRAEAETLATRVLAAVGDSPFALEETNETIRKTCSIGWAAFPWYQDDPNSVHYEEVRTMADRALGEAKRAGKNRAIGVFPVGPAKSVVSEPQLLVSRIPVEKLCTIGPAIS